jgi:hypothetical protein
MHVRILRCSGNEIYSNVGVVEESMPLFLAVPIGNTIFKLFLS